VRRGLDDFDEGESTGSRSWVRQLAERVAMRALFVPASRLPKHRKMLAASGDEFGGEGNGRLVFEEEREAFAKLNDDAGSELARESDFDFDEADLGAGEAAGWSRAWLGHPGEDARLAADWQGVDLGTFMDHGKCINHQLMATRSGKRQAIPGNPRSTSCPCTAARALSSAP
jgi:hypothetical protein